MSDTKRKIKNFNKRWNIISEEDHKKEFSKFKTRIQNILYEVDKSVVEEGIIQFCNLIGTPVEWQHTSMNRYSLNIIDAFKRETNESEFYRLIEYLFIIKFRDPNSIFYNSRSSQENYFHLIKEVIDSSRVNVSILINGEDVILIPRGEELLDKILVDEVLTFLNKESNIHFVNALNFYKKPDSVKSAESLRRSLEEFLRFKLKNDKGLNNNITELQKNLKTDGIELQIRNIIFSTFNYLDQYFNENSKHKDGDIDEVENEFLIYQTGVLIRFIDKEVK